MLLDPVVIQKLPEVPEPILKKANDRALCFFLGSGISRSLGCKSWKEIADSLIEKCFDLNLINSKMKESILEITDSKKIITFCRSKLRKNNYEKIYFDQIGDCLRPNASLLFETKNIYKVLSSLQGNIHSFYLTTNIDTIFDTDFRDTVFFDKKGFSEPRPNILYKIHGSIEHHASIIFTVSEYLERYSDENFVGFLRRIFDSCAIIFLGYGLEEFEILDFLVTKIGSRNKKELHEKRLNHCILWPYDKGKEYMIEFYKECFEPLGVDVVGYEKCATDDHSRLYDIVKKWTKDLTEQTIIPHEDIKNMYKLVDSFEWK